MKEYKDLVNDVLQKGRPQTNRTGVNTLSVFGRSFTVDLSVGFPLLTTKKVWYKGVLSELLWFISGSTNVAQLLENQNNIWNEWADENGDLGPVYGHQWRRWQNIDQLGNVISQIKINPDSRRLLVSAWNVEDIPNMALPPCHYSFQFHVCDGKLSLAWNQRSVDVALGLPFNLASYATLCHMVAQVCDLEVGTLTFFGGNVHIYENHIAGLKEQLTRKERWLPTLDLDPDVKNIDDFTMDDVKVIGYNPHPTIKFEVAV